MTDPRIPVIAGAAQRTYRADPPPPLDQMAEVAREAGGALLAKVASVAVVESFSWPAQNPGGPLSERLGIHPRETVRSARGGNGPLALVQDAARRVAAGELDVALVVGAEAMTPYMRAVKAGEQTGWSTDSGAPSRVVGRDRDASHPAETAAGLIAPIFYYPLIEHAHRAAAGRTTAEHVDWIARWWARFSDVAAANEHAWSRDALEPAEIATPSDANRLVSSPYTKVMNANIQVDQAAALLVTTREAALGAGIPEDDLVYVQGAAGGNDHWFVGERPDLTRSPVLAGAHRALGQPEPDHVDIYSCFPSAVQTGAKELGIDLETQTPTVTGGLSFFGGPANNYATHSVATLVDRLNQEGGTGLATAVGWYLTKHHVLVLGKEPVQRGFHAVEPSGPRTTIVASKRMTAPVESFTALYDRDGTPTMAIAAVRENDRRAFGKTHDDSVIADLLQGDSIGTTATVENGELQR